MSPGAGVGRRQELAQGIRASALTCGGVGPLAKATATALHRRELFYDLVDAFRGYQARVQDAAGGVGMADEAQRVDGEVTKGADDAREAGYVADSACGGCGQLPSITEPGGRLCGTSGGGIGDGGAGGIAASGSDLSSMSIRTLCDFGAPEHRSASTQTVAKVRGVLLRWKPAVAVQRRERASIACCYGSKLPPTRSSKTCGGPYTRSTDETGSSRKQTILFSRICTRETLRIPLGTGSLTYS